MEQSEGGPCSIIAPIQAFIIKNLLIEYDGFSFRDAVSFPSSFILAFLIMIIFQMTEEIQNKMLIRALCEVLQQCNVQKYYVVYLRDKKEKLINGDNPCGSQKDECDITPVAMDPFTIHCNMRIRMLASIQEIEKYFTSNIIYLKAQYGILLFLYSVIASKVSCGDLFQTHFILFA